MADQPQPTLSAQRVMLLSEQPLTTYTDRHQINIPAVELVRPLVAGIDREIGVVISVDTKQRVLAVDTVSVGTVMHTFFLPTRGDAHGVATRCIRVRRGAQPSIR